MPKAGPQPQGLDPAGLGQSRRTYTSNKFPGDGEAAGLQSTILEPLPHKKHETGTLSHR